MMTKAHPLWHWSMEFFARKVFASPTNAIGRYFKRPDGTRLQIIGIVEDGKYDHVAEDPQPAMFLPYPAGAHEQHMGSSALGIRFASTKLAYQRGFAKPGCQLAGLRRYLEPRTGTCSVSFAYGGHSAGRLWVSIGAMLSITGIFGMAAYSVSKRLRELGIRMALGAQRKEVLRAALGRPVRLLAFGSGLGLLMGILASRVLAHIVFRQRRAILGC